MDKQISQKHKFIFFFCISRKRLLYPIKDKSSFANDCFEMLIKTTEEATQRDH